MKLTLPYPISANRYWRTMVLPGANHATTYVSPEAKRYKRQVKIAAVDQGLREPFPHRVRIDLFLYPARPQDWERRARRNPMCWDDDVRCINLDNAWKVMIDALNGVAYADDKWLWEQGGKRMEPDADGERVIVTIEPIVRESPQPMLVLEAPLVRKPEPERMPF